MSRESKLVAGILLIVLPSVMFGGIVILNLLIGHPAYTANALHQDLWRAGHAHAGVFLVLSLVVLQYVDSAALSDGAKWYVRVAVPLAAIFIPLAFFLSVMTPEVTQPTRIINLAYVGAALLATGVLTLGIGLVRNPGKSKKSKKKRARARK